MADNALTRYVNGGAELNQWDPPWYQRLPYALTDIIYGDSANARQGSLMNKLAGPENPINLPGQVAEGADRARGGYERSDLGEMAAGAIGIVGGLAPAAVPAVIAGRMGPSVRQTLREHKAWEANTPAARASKNVDSGSRQFDQVAGQVEKDKLLDAADRAGGMRNLQRDFEGSLGPIDWMVYKTGGGFYGGEPSKLKTVLSPGHIAAQGANVAANDWLWNLGIMPWSWKEPGTMTGNPVQSEMEKMSGRPDSDFRYPPPFPRLERTEQQMREMYDQTRTGGYMDNRYGLLGGGKLPYDEWLKIKERYGGTLHYPPSMNALGNHNYPIGPERTYGPGPYPAAPNPASPRNALFDDYYEDQP